VLVQLWGASTKELELQIIYDTIMLQGAVSAWTTHDDIICYNGHYYIPIISPLLQDLLKSIDITAPHLLAIGLHTTTVSPTTLASSSSILLLEEWPHLRLPSATVVFFDDNGQQFLSISDVYINRQLAHGHPMISPADYNIGDLLFGQL
jgi:hypothetical protein